MVSTGIARGRYTDFPQYQRRPKFVTTDLLLTLWCLTVAPVCGDGPPSHFMMSNGGHSLWWRTYFWLCDCKRCQQQPVARHNARGKQPWNYRAWQNQLREHVWYVSVYGECTRLVLRTFRWSWLPSLTAHCWPYTCSWRTCGVCLPLHRALECILFCLYTVSHSLMHHICLVCPRVMRRFIMCK